MKRLLSNSTGMGLVEVLVAIGLLGGLSLVVTHLMTNSQKSVEHLENSSDMLTTVQGIQSLLANPLNCTASFAGKRLQVIIKIQLTSFIRLRRQGDL